MPVSLYDTPTSRPLTTLDDATNTFGAEQQMEPASYSAIDPPARSRFLAFGSNERNHSVAVGRSQKEIPKLESTKEGSMGKVFNRSEYWDDVLCKYKQHPTFLEELVSPRAPYSPFVQPSSFAAHEVLTQTRPTQNNTPPLFPKSRDYLSLLHQSAAEAETSLARAVIAARTDPIIERALFMTLSPESDSSSSSLSPFAFSPSPRSSLSGGSAITTPEFSPFAEHRTLCAPYQTPVGQDWTEYRNGQAVEIRRVMEELAEQVQGNRRYVERMTKENDACSYESQARTSCPSAQVVRGDTPRSSHTSPAPAAFDSRATSPIDLIEPQQTSRPADTSPEPKPADHYVRRAQERIRAQRITPWRRARGDAQGAPASIEDDGHEDNEGADTTSVIARPKPDVPRVAEYRGDPNVSWPSPPPPELLRSSIPPPVPFSRPFVFHPTFDVDTVDLSTGWPSPPPPSLLQSDIPKPVPGFLSMLQKYYADFQSVRVAGPTFGDELFAETRDVTSMASSWDMLGNAGAVVNSREASREDQPMMIRVPKPKRPIAIGVMEWLVRQWEEEANA